MRTLAYESKVEQGRKYELKKFVEIFIDKTCTILGGAVNVFTCDDDTIFLAFSHLGEIRNK